MLRAFASKQLRRVRQLRPMALPATLALVLSVFALVQLPSANTLWLKALKASADVGASFLRCSPDSGFAAG